jgi:hypothetical protein
VERQRPASSLLIIDFLPQAHPRYCGVFLLRNRSTAVVSIDVCSGSSNTPNGKPIMQSNRQPLQAHFLKGSTPPTGTSLFRTSTTRHWQTQQRYKLSLSSEDMAVQKAFSKAQREPTGCRNGSHQRPLSEHCKTPHIRCPNRAHHGLWHGDFTDGLFKTYIKATTTKSWYRSRVVRLSAFHDDNAGFYRLGR